MAHLDISDGLFIEYETFMVSGLKRCLNAQIDFTGMDLDQMKGAVVILENMGLDDNQSLVCHIEECIYNGKI